MKPTVESIESIAEAAVPTIEHELGRLGYPFDNFEPEMRMRMAGACGVTSETFRQLLDQADGIEGELWIRDVPSPSKGRHVLLTVSGGEETIVIDGSYAQFLGVYGPDWIDALFDRPPRLPEQRTMVFRDGEQSEIAEWLAMVTDLSGERSGTLAEIKDFFESLWNLEEYEPYEAAPYIKNDGSRVSRAVMASSRI